MKRNGYDESNAWNSWISLAVQPVRSMRRVFGCAKVSRDGVDQDRPYQSVPTCVKRMIADPCTYDLGFKNQYNDSLAFA